METIDTVYVCQKIASNGDTMYLHQDGYGTWTYKLRFAMLQDKPESFDFFLKHSGQTAETVKFQKLFICKEIS